MTFGMEDWGAWSCAWREATVCSSFQLFLSGSFLRNLHNATPTGPRESESRFTQDDEEESTGEGSLEEGISTGNSTDWPGIRKNGSSATLSGAPSAVGFDEGQDANETDPATLTLIPWHLRRSATGRVAGASCTDFLTEVGMGKRDLATVWASSNKSNKSPRSDQTSNAVLVLGVLPHSATPGSRTDEPTLRDIRAATADILSLSPGLQAVCRDRWGGIPHHLY